MGRTLTNDQMRMALKGDRFKTVKKAITQEYMCLVKQELTAENVQKALDEGGGTNQCWTAIFKAFDSAFNAVGLSARKCIPCPHAQRQVCGYMNEAFAAMNPSMVTEEDREPADAGDEDAKIMSNIQLDITALLQTLVHLYGITAQEVDGTLKVCLKLDETIWAGDRKMERLTVTVMNRALVGKDACEEELWFHVQSERELWPVGMFEVTKESHSALKRFLSTSHLNNVIKQHNAGEKLAVRRDDGELEHFKVEWHAAGDLKTLKCMHGCQTCPNAECVCLYCMHARPKPNTSAGAKGRQHAGQRRTWAGGIMSCRSPQQLGKAPDRDKLDPLWDAVLAIPLERIHICTMHGENRVVEKLVHLHICKVWNMKKGEQRDQRLKAMETFLAEDIGMRLRGQPFKIEECEKLSGKYGSTPIKPSFNDVKARIFTEHASRRVDKVDQVTAQAAPRPSL